MARKRRNRPSTGNTILLVDDNPEYLEATRRVISRDGHEVLVADNAPDGLNVLAERHVDLVLVDYLMPGMTGEDFVREMRTFRSETQVILQTGYASEHPPRELLRRMDIQGYHDKSDGPEKLLVWIDVGLKAAYSQQLLLGSRAGLRYILDVTPTLHRMQPLDDLLQGILLQTCGLLGVTNGFVAALDPRCEGSEDGFVAMPRDDGLAVRAATGRYEGIRRIEEAVDDEMLTQMRAVMKDGESFAGHPKATIAALRVGNTTLGLIFFDRPLEERWKAELVELFANQAAVAIHNVSLYEMAALDSLTGTMTRRFFEMAVRRELRASTRTELETAILLVDVDQMKTINDAYGHTCGDRALAAVGTCLRRVVRATDIVGRIGGDEFAVLLPQTDCAGARIVAARIRASMAALTIEHGEAAVPVHASVGGAVLANAAAFDAGRIEWVIESAFQRLVRAADEAMYRHKRRSGSGEDDIPRVPWAA